MSDLYIPKKIKVGFQKRSDTYTGKLGFITYYDDKEVLRQEKSWNGWRDHKIEVMEFENKPRANYVFNKGVQRNGYWGSGRSVVRVYDTRDFEFEISIDNLIGILMHSDVSKRDIVEECVFAWSGKHLVLLPVNSEEYRESLKFTEKQSQNISAKELVKGYTYNMKKEDTSLIYMGYFEWYDWESYYSKVHTFKGKKHVFYNGSEFVIPSVSSLASVISEEINENYANLVDKFLTTIHARPFNKIEIKDKSKLKKNYLLFKQNSKQLVSVSWGSYYNSNKTEINLGSLYFAYYNVKYDKSVRLEDERRHHNYNTVCHELIEIREALKSKNLLKETDSKYHHKDYYSTVTRTDLITTLKELGYGYLNLVDKDSKEFEVSNEY